MRAETPEYLVDRVRKALLEEPALSEQGLEVVVDADVLIVRGSVLTPERHQAVDAVLSRVAPRRTARNETVVSALEPPGPDEEIS